MIVYFVGGPLSYIAADLKAPAAASWLPVTNTLANAAAAPFAGYLQDLLGRRYISLAALCCVIIGCVLVGSSHSMAQAIAGMAVTGAGAGVCELTALAGWVTPIFCPSQMCRYRFSFANSGCAYKVSQIWYPSNIAGTSLLE